jgi:hypothetical protein
MVRPRTGFTVDFRNMHVDGLQVDSGFELILGFLDRSLRFFYWNLRVHIAEVSCTFKHSRILIVTGLQFR